MLLSLDFRGEVFQGPAVLLDDPASWPARVIVMTLARVGAAAGPDMDRVAGIVARAQGRQVFGAGGVRDYADIGALATAGAAGVLVATALHTGALTSGTRESGRRWPSPLIQALLRVRAALVGIAAACPGPYDGGCQAITPLRPDNNNQAANGCFAAL